MVGRIDIDARFGDSRVVGRVDGSEAGQGRAAKVLADRRVSISLTFMKGQADHASKTGSTITKFAQSLRKSTSA